MTIRTRNDDAVNRLEPFLVTAPFNVPHMNLAPFGRAIAPEHVFDPLRQESVTFRELVHRLDAATFGPTGMPMPQWVFFDGAELPGGVFGFGRRADQLGPVARALFDVPDDYRGLVPFAMFIAIPMRTRGAWMGHNLASLNPQLPNEKLGGLASITKAFGLAAFGARTQYGATQWRSPALHIHTRFGPLELVTAYTPAHSEPRTLTYCFDVTDNSLRAAAGDPDVILPRRAATEFLDSDDEGAMRALQSKLEAGTHRAWIADRPRTFGGRVEVPVTVANVARRKDLP